MATQAVRDLRGIRVRMTYHHRDPALAPILGLRQGQQGPFDWDEIVEGEVAPAVYHESCGWLWGIRLDDGTFRFAFLRPEAPLAEESNMRAPSQWDGRQNGTFEIVPV